MAITEKQYHVAADLIGCEVAVIKAVASVESNGSGFLPDGRIKILFEPHIFWRELNAVKYNFTNILKANADILYKFQGERPYGTYKQQYDRLAKASKIHPEAARKSCSWGKYQPMGTYHKEMGFDTVDAMVKRFSLNEYEQMMGFVRMIKFRKLDDELREKRFAAFAEKYNGAGYRVGNYDGRIKKAYADYIAAMYIRFSRQH